MNTRTGSFLAKCVLLGGFAFPHAQNAAAQSIPSAILPSARLTVGAEGDSVQEFDRVVTPFLMPDGRLVVPLSSANTIRVFTAAGRFVNSLGRRGAGPGEFTRLSAAWPRGDTIEAFDHQLRRITRFLPNGRVEVVTLRGTVRDLSLTGAAMGEGWMAGGVASGGRGRRDSVVLHHFARDGSDRGEIARTLGFARYQSPVMSGPEPFSPRPVVGVQRGLLYIADNQTPSIRVMQSNGTVQRTITWQPGPAISPREALRTVIDAAVAKAPANQAVNTRIRWEAAPVRERLPAFSCFIVDDLGFIWVRPYEPLKHSMALGGLMLPGGGPGGRWTILSPAGVKVGEVDMPSDFEPLRITSDAVIGVALDEFDVETVRVHSIQRRR
ncbi:MAG: 6-bladed beta-propeller [Gemmatimonadota bacterium]